MAFENPDTESIRALLAGVHTIALVGYSPNPSRPSHSIAVAMQRMGFRIIPVRPGIGDALGETVYPDLLSVPENIDLVNVFRNGRHADEMVDQCLELGLNKLWLQEGCINEAAAMRAREAGMMVVMNRCILRDASRLLA